MDGERFDRLIVLAAASRRGLLAGVAAAAIGSFAAPGVEARRPHTRKPARPNAFGCFDVGVACKHAGQCCSGVCKGKSNSKKRTCRAHDTGGCRPGGHPTGCGGGTDIVCTTSTGNPEGVCATTTGHGGYCVYSGACFPCTKDADCQAFCGPQGACFLCDDCPDTGGTSCGSPENNGCDFPSTGTVAGDNDPASATRFPAPIVGDGSKW